MAIAQDDTLFVHETFQDTVQGEGFWTGAKVDFIRLAGCPVGCPWCDTGYADGGRGLPRIKRSVEGLLSELKSARVVISGGEPFAQLRLPILMDALIASGKHVSIETSGSFWTPVSPQAWITLSPKEHVNSRYPVQSKFWSRANEVKLVIDDGTEVAFYKERLKRYMGYVYLQPQWTNKERALSIILGLLQEHPHWRLSVQTHKLIGVE